MAVEAAREGARGGGTPERGLGAPEDLTGGRGRRVKGELITCLARRCVDF